MAFANHTGFNYFAFSTTYFTSNNQSKAVQFNNYPTRWNLEYEQDEMCDIDPVVADCNLSEREVDVLNLAAAGKTAEESARILNLSPRTIHFHIQSAIEKFGVSNKISAIVAAMKAGLLDDASTRCRVKTCG